MKMENLKGGFKVLIVIVAVLCYSCHQLLLVCILKGHDGSEENIRNGEDCWLRQHGSHVYSGQSNRRTHKNRDDQSNDLR